MPWVKPQFTRGEVDRAGDFLLNEKSISQTYFENDDIDGFIEESDRAYAIINNWRSSHSYPLQIIKMTLKNRARSIDTGAIVAQRIKRLSSIESKLNRNQKMKLSRMQDLGGCRAVLGTTRRVMDLAKAYERAAAKNPSGRPEFIRKYDYIAEPKTDGYRSLHLVYQYRTQSAELAAYNGLRIEIQLRSRLQHAWATAVETVSTFTGQALKSSGGEETWKRFFALMGSAIARREGMPQIPNTPTNFLELRDELRHCTQYLDVQNRLQMYGNALRGVPTISDFQDAKYFLLTLNLKRQQISIRGFREQELERATSEYLAVEKQEKTGTVSDAVLVSVDSMASLRRAYPNYFLDTRVFVDAVNKAIGLVSASASRSPSASPSPSS